jgi:hypothetical protein
VATQKKSKSEEVEIRRAPKIGPWAITGAVFGAIAAFVLYLFIPESQRSSADILGLLILSLGSLGLGLGIAFAITVDLVTSRNAKKVVASRESE